MPLVVTTRIWIALHVVAAPLAVAGSPRTLRLRCVLLSLSFTRVRLRAVVAHTYTLRLISSWFCGFTRLHCTRCRSSRLRLRTRFSFCARSLSSRFHARVAHTHAHVAACVCVCVALRLRLLHTFVLVLVFVLPSHSICVTFTVTHTARTRALDLRTFTFRLRCGSLSSSSFALGSLSRALRAFRLSRLRLRTLRTHVHVRLHFVAFTRALRSLWFAFCGLCSINRFRALRAPAWLGLRLPAVTARFDITYTYTAYTHAHVYRAFMGYGSRYTALAVTLPRHACRAHYHYHAPTAGSRCHRA